MQIPERLDRRVHQSLRAFEVGDAVGVRHRFAAHGDDLVDDLLGRRSIGAVTVDITTKVVDDDLRALRREIQGVFAPDAASGAGDDRDPSVPVSYTHLTLPTN